MMEGSKRSCKSTSHKLFKDKAKNRVDDLQGLFTDLQLARKESRAGDVALIEEQVHQMLKEWGAELNEPSPASSLLGGSLGSFSADLQRLLEQRDEEDDATSALKETGKPKPEPDVPNLPERDAPTIFHEDYFVHQDPKEHEFEGHVLGSPPVMNQNLMNGLDVANQFELNQFNLHQEYDNNPSSGFDFTGQFGEDAIPYISDLLPAIYLPPSAFLGPICALWDCPRPVQVSEWYEDYCSSYHAGLAMNEGPPGMSPVVRPGGIGLKDGPLFSSLNAKTQGKHVGIPVCEGAATTKSPWNAPELFDLSLVNGETIREWLFFDKPRRAFESGTRKQRSLPDYAGRGWHESRKQVMKEFGGSKRSYYMDPQPLTGFEWHLYEYEIDNSDASALYRLEFKLSNGKKSPKGKVSTDPLVDLQKQMGRLTAVSQDNKLSVKGSRSKVNMKEKTGNLCSVPNQIPGPNENFSYGVSAADGYTVDNLKDYCGT